MMPIRRDSPKIFDAKMAEIVYSRHLRVGNADEIIGLADEITFTSR